MLERLKTLLWLRFKIIISNKSILAQIILPVVLTFFYKYLGTVENNVEIPGQDAAMLMMCLMFFFILSVGTPISAILSDEKEKKNLNTLLISGVKNYEYISSTLIIPLILSFLSIIVTPIILNINLVNYSQYVFIALFTSIPIILIYLLIGTYSKNQISSQIASMFAMLIILFLPIIASLNEKISQIIDYSFIGLFYELFDNNENLNQVNLTIPIISLIIWILLLIYLNIYSLQKKNGGHNKW